MRTSRLPMAVSTKAISSYLIYVREKNVLWKTVWKSSGVRLLLAVKI